MLQCLIIYLFFNQCKTSKLEWERDEAVLVVDVRIKQLF